jgi:hypothetical protein
MCAVVVAVAARVATAEAAATLAEAPVIGVKPGETMKWGILEVVASDARNVVCPPAAVFCVKLSAGTAILTSAKTAKSARSEARIGFMRGLPGVGIGGRTL